MDEQDNYLFEYAVKIAKLAKTEKIDVLHVAKDRSLPEEIANSYKEIKDPDIDVRTYIDQIISGNEKFDKINNYSVHSLQGNALDEILKFTVENDIEMIIAGRKPEIKESGSLAEKLARKAPCSVLAVPCCTFSYFNSILVPIDFSEHSEYAVDVATAIASAKGLSEITALHLYHVPIGFHKTGKSDEEFAEIMKNNSIKEYGKFIKNIDLKGINLNAEFLLNEKIEQGILGKINETQTDLVVMSSRGRGAGLASLLSTGTERVLSHTDVPLLAVKPKDAGLSL